VFSPDKCRARLRRLPHRAYGKTQAQAREKPDELTERVSQGLKPFRCRLLPPLDFGDVSNFNRAFGAEFGASTSKLPGGAILSSFFDLSDSSNVQRDLGSQSAG
jgi:hypothetical protein